uniref:Uncharacterized protein n=1 Tax=Rhodospirillum rubrum TaxID=1085 RepID=O30839_RHORU|nr:unknown [Rhodospirillum rubrum ATCC 11170]
MARMIRPLSGSPHEVFRGFPLLSGQNTPDNKVRPDLVGWTSYRGSSPR